MGVSLVRVIEFRSFSRVTPTQDLTEAGTRRKRAQRACEACHSHKTKCSGEFPKCRRCLENGLNCEYKVSRRKFTAAPGASASPTTPLNPVQNVASRSLPSVVSAEAKQLISPSASSVSPGLTDANRKPSLGSVLNSEDILARVDLLSRHFDVWFETWGRLPLMSIFHPGQTYQGIHDKTLSPHIVRCVCAMTARFLIPGSRSLPLFAEKCAEDVDQYILQQISTFLRGGDGLENLLILLLTICHFWVESQMGKVWMYMGLAGRLITALQMNWDGAVDTPIKQEIIRRAVWTIWKLDRYLASGFDEHLILRDEVMHLKFPATDSEFPAEGDMTMATPTLGQTRPGQTPLLADPPTRHPRPAQLEPSQFLNQVSKLQQMLLTFSQSLPEYLKVSDIGTVQRWFNSPQRGSFVMLYTTFWELYIDLYRFSVPGLREQASAEIAKQLPSDFVVSSQKQAVGYAICLSRFWRCGQAVADQKPWVDGRERLLTVDQTLHRLYDNLVEGSSAPLIRQEVVNDDTLAALIQSNMKLFDAFAVFFPATIENHGTPYDNPRETIGRLVRMPARKPPENVRLPGPHYMLEQAIAPPDYEERDKHRNRSGADVLLRQRRQPSGLSSVPSSAGTGSAGTSQRPDIPVWLAEARNGQAAPGTLAIPQQSPVMPALATAQPPESQAFVQQPVYARAGSLSNPLGTYHNTPSAFPPPPPPTNTNQHTYTASILGPSLGRDDHPGFYHRAGGKTLPFPDIDSII
ncbi:hypothetical protein M406DRAFT_66909 [Cryphonectria parasitica EP155]|uniref:Zn(2)-C6 fungal-type domain-containing protein n=1 Tax=Cryphonectria parasitica (strain ATCC 38755 / EP155) TaxID=660469 RepID=A0A9P5CTC5_CRYP1|nr:uncharacterized protein M406DRAFT_66909 [Cryphonectria parasitica EP155]KAF3770509.1 hypothetical protein M406DRAFT_66909 [Cryphonectria parasitica EP155]